MTTATRYLRTNVLGLVAIFIALTAGAYAAGKAGKNTVVSKSIKDGQVKGVDLAPAAVDGTKVADDSLGGAQIDESSLAQVPSALNAANATSAASAANASQLGGQGPAAFQQRVAGTCTGVQAVQSIAADGSVGCGGGGGGGTTYSAAANGGLALTGTAFRLAPCATGQVLKATGATTWACAADNAGGPPSGAASGDLTGSYPNPQVANNAIAGPELAVNSVSSTVVTDNSLTATDINESTLDSSVVQKRITGLPCPGGQAVSNVQATGAASCATTSPSGSAGGDLQGTYPAPTIKGGAVTPPKFATLPAGGVTGPSFNWTSGGNYCSGSPGPVPTHTTVFMAFATETFDTTNFVDPLTPGCYLGMHAPLAGTYIVTASIHWSANATGDRKINLWSTTGTVFASSEQAAAPVGHETRQSVSQVFRLPQNASVDVQAFQTSGAPLAIAGGNLTMAWIGP